MLFVVRLAKPAAACFVLSFGQTKNLVDHKEFDMAMKTGAGLFSNPSLSRSHSSRVPPSAWLTLNGNCPLWPPAHNLNDKPIIFKLFCEAVTDRKSTRLNSSHLGI